MKNLLVIFSALLVLTSCATTKETRTSKVEARKEKQIADQAIIKKAVESRQFIVKFDRIYLQHGGMIDLRPRSNFLIIDGETATIKAAYLGRQYDIKPIEGIRVVGQTVKYESTIDTLKNKYEIVMKIENRSNTFDVYLTVGKKGTCSVSITNIKLDPVRYSGYIVPIIKKTNVPLNEKNVISASVR
jgi:hypothetical protein